MKHIDVRDLTAGLSLVAIGTTAALYAGSHYQVGSPAQMGPGFFPVALGWILAALGVIIGLLAFRRTLHTLNPPPFALRPLLAVLMAVFVFTQLVERAGLVPATWLLVLVAALAERPYRWGRTLLLAVILSFLVWLVFTVALQMTLPAFVFRG